MLFKKKSNGFDSFGGVRILIYRQFFIKKLDGFNAFTYDRDYDDQAYSTLKNTSNFTKLMSFMCLKICVPRFANPKKLIKPKKFPIWWKKVRQLPGRLRNENVLKTFFWPRNVDAGQTTIAFMVPYLTNFGMISSNIHWINIIDVKIFCFIFAIIWVK